MKPVKAGVVGGGADKPNTEAVDAGLAVLGAWRAMSMRRMRSRDWKLLKISGKR